MEIYGRVMIGYAPWIVFLLAMVSSMASDIYKMKIPNTVIFLLIGFFFIRLAAGEISFSDVALHTAAALLVLCLTFIAFILGWMGGGDAKLIAATALWFGPSVALLDYIVVASVAGGFLALLVLFARACMRPVTGYASLDRLLDPKSGIPYGVALGASGLFVSLGMVETRSLLGLI